MADLADGESTTMQGSAASPYVLKRVGRVYSCSCPAWRFQRTVGVENRSCKHLRRLRGDAEETARITAVAPLPPPRVIRTTTAMAAGQRQPALKVLEGPGHRVGDLIRLGVGRIEAGRSGLGFADDQISKKESVFLQVGTDGGIDLRIMPGSHQPVQVNQASTEGGRRLQEGDRLRYSRCEFEFTFLDPDPDYFDSCPMCRARLDRSRTVARDLLSCGSCHSVIRAPGGMLLVEMTAGPVFRLVERLSEAAANGSVVDGLRELALSQPYPPFWILQLPELAPLVRAYRSVQLCCHARRSADGRCLEELDRTPLPTDKAGSTFRKGTKFATTFHGFGLLTLILPQVPPWDKTELPFELVEPDPGAIPVAAPKPRR